jgi:hypothetical protein
VNAKRSWRARRWLVVGFGLAVALALGVATPKTAEAQAQCASENGTCSFSGVAGVVYGANGAFNAKMATNSIACNTASFGGTDPVPGVVKACYSRAYTLCASENGTCSFSGVADVAYGANGSFLNHTATNSFACNTANFGGTDPAPGVVKSCYYLSRTQCASENGTCSFTGTGDVAYGANASFNGKQTVVNSIACNNTTFVDPIPGTAKACYLMVVSTSTSGGGSGIGSIVSSAQFDQMWNPSTRSATYTYADFVTAANSYYPALCGTGGTTVQKRECAAYFASKDQETGMGQYDRELYCQPGGGGYGGTVCNYCDSGNQPCGACAGGQQYWGRHAVQLSWNYNYCNAGNGMGLGTGLHTDPNSIFNNKVTGWRASDWYWMTQLGPAVSNGYGTWPQETAHSAITSTAAGLHGFGGIIRAVNGGIECGSRVQQQINRVTYFVGSGYNEAAPGAGSTAAILGYAGTTADGISGQHLWCSP